MMNQSMQSMYKATSSQQTSDDEGGFEQAVEPSKNQTKEGNYKTLIEEYFKLSSSVQS